MRILTTLFCSAVLALTLSSCIEETCEDTIIFQGFEPVIVNQDDWRNNSTFLCWGPIDVCEATGFYVYEQYLFMVEDGKGLHIIDNSDSRNPQPVTWMEVPGGQGLAVRNNILYMNQYTDLVAFDLTDPEKPEYISRTENVFEPGSVFTRDLGNGNFVASWSANGERRVVDCNSPNGGQSVFEERGVFFGASADAVSSSFSNLSNSGAETVGRGGSLARFTISQGTLYAVDDSRLKAFSLANERQPEFVQNIEIGFGIETIFPTSDKLFIGSTTGMQIFSIEDPLVPEHLSTFEHVLSCDPVVVAGNLAYVTLWGGRDCGSVGDQLEIIDVSDARNPVSLQVTPMSASHGLGVAEGKLFLCSQYLGFKVYDLTDEGLLGRQLDENNSINARDVIMIPENNNAIVLGYNGQGIQQFDYSDEGRLTPTSSISVCQ